MRKNSPYKTESNENIIDSGTEEQNGWSTKIKRRATKEKCLISRGLQNCDSAISSFVVDIREGLQKGEIELTNLVISKARKSKALNKLDETGFSVLHHATRHNRVESVRDLLENGAHVNITSSQEHITPLHIAIRFGWNEMAKTLLEYSANPSIHTNNGCTPLHLACKRGNKQGVSLLLDVENIDVNAKDKVDMTALHMAAIQGDEEICRMLLAKGADYKEQADDLTTPLHIALACGNDNAALIILKKVLGGNPDLDFISRAGDIDGNSFLHLAALSNNLEVAEAILEHYGTSVNATTSNLSTPFHLACSKGHVRMVKLLIDKKADLEAKDIDGRTPLHICAHFNQADTITLLLDKGAAIDSRDLTNQTPFLVAVTAGYTESARILISRGADVSCYDSSMKNCLHLAAKNGSVKTLSLILENESCLENLNKPDMSERVPLHYAAMSDDIKVLQALLSKQKRFVFHDENQKTPLHLACENGRVEQAEALAHASSSINDRNDEGKTALHIAASFGHRKVCSKLVCLGADVNFRDNNRWTPLMCAAQIGSSKTCTDLLENKASIDDANNEGNSALLIATISGQAGVVKILLDHGASVTVRNNDGFSLVEVAAKYGVHEVVMEICRHQRWKEVMEMKDSYGHPTMKILIQHFPNAAKLIMNYCVQKARHMNQSDPKYSVTYDFSLLDPGPDDRAALDGHPYFGPLSMVNYNRQQLLEHSLTQTLLDYKWLSFGRFVFYFNFFSYIAFTSCFTSLVVFERSRMTFLKNGSVTGGIYEGSPHYTVGRLAYVVLLFAVLQVIKEILQMLLQGWDYFKEVSNSIEWGLYLSAISFMIPYINTNLLKIILGKLSSPHYLWISGVISIFLCYMNLVLFMRRFRISGIYVTMFLEVLKTIGKVMTVFGVFVVAFALVFYILFKELIQFRTVAHSLITVVTMMVGELEYVDTFVVPKGEENPISITAYVFCLLFLSIMSLAVMNLLIGLAVGDIDFIQRDAVLKRLAMQVEFVAQIENKYPRFVTRRHYKPVVVTYPNETTLQTWIRNHLFSMNVSAEKFSTTEDIEDDNDRCQYVYNKLKKTQKQVKTLVHVIETQNRLLKDLAKKIDPELDVMSITEEDLVGVNDIGHQDEAEGFDPLGSHGNESSHDFSYRRT